MKVCTDKEREFLDLLIGQPNIPTTEDKHKLFKLMEEIRLGD